MTDEIFMNELSIRAYMDQLAGYPFGHPGRINLKPILAVHYRAEGKIDREKTLDSPVYGKFTPEQRAKLLEVG